MGSRARKHPRKTTMFEEFRSACDHDFADTNIKTVQVGPWSLTRRYMRCVDCGYREVEYWTLALGSDAPILRREPV
jgi:hypothetical protein